MTRKLFLYATVLLLSSCASVDTYNQQISKTHSPEDLRNDVDYAYKKLRKLHPDIYWYISKEELEERVNRLKSELTKPLTSKEFYNSFAPVFTSIKQGHLSIHTPSRKQTKEEIKEKGKRSSPFKSLSFQTSEDKLFVRKIFKDNIAIIEGSEIVRVEDEKVSDLLSSFKKLHASDGFNKTFIPEFVGSRFGFFYSNTHKQKDSLLLHLKLKDSLYSKYVYADYDKIKTSSKKDSTGVKDEKKSKLDKKIAKEVRKKTRKKNYKYGYNKKAKDYNRNFIFLESDSLIGYMHIKSFTNGGYKEFYKESFAKIDSAKCKNLVIDLRGNLGGRLTEIDDLYSYLTDKEYVFIEKSKMTGRLSFLYPYFHTKSWPTKTMATIFSPVLGVYQMFKVKKENGEAYFKFKHSKLRKPKPNGFDGKVYVLIDGESFSASSILSTHLKATKRATFVGEETGGAYNGTVAGIYAKVELPNSRINMRVGLMKINAPYSIEPDGYGIKPDVPIKKILNDKDEELQWIIQDIEMSDKK
ncbi:Peptidase family S41 [Aquimarina amphilecti]|uniref:Peptidase family S41 n=1 Tax=Aquimarina amphilecti TaxID=1038014 RepID=A0A1H7MN57_AQUAM|nr:S41 family peptidase [Aquimarina amphilecti]SEL12047.1 Peptidase family S41 [Aquimarina amphilecti]